MEMLTVTAAEFQRHFGRYQDEALTQPVAITRNGRERLVMISADEYCKLRRRAREESASGFWPAPRRSGSASSRALGERRGPTPAVLPGEVASRNGGDQQHILAFGASPHEGVVSKPPGA